MPEVGSLYFAKQGAVLWDDLPTVSTRKSIDFWEPAYLRVLRKHYIKIDGPGTTWLRVTVTPAKQGGQPFDAWIQDTALLSPTIVEQRRPN